jgi:hypothetical protein
LFIYKDAIDIDTDERQRDRFRQDLTLIEIATPANSISSMLDAR